MTEKPSSQNLLITPPGGNLESHHWLELAAEAERIAGGVIYLTPNSGLELRNVSQEPAKHIRRLHHSQVLASPLHAEARELAFALAQYDFAGRQVGVEGGDGLISALNLDLCVVLDGWTADILVAGQPAKTGIMVEEVAQEVLSTLHQAPQGTGTTPTLEASSQPIGWLPHEDNPGTVSLGARVADNAIPAAHAEMIGRMEVATSVTPWGGIVFHDLSEEDADVVVRFLAPRGYIFDAGSPLLK
ncbi:hypothetical protein CPHO_06140 [Corynebacterium phocae]|uniref:Uncharacterized protein n=1 Tax=Corynebacterium phocae TaxID=161895 RepID=A0A1L7D386_9CORY|nr:hypothetical protein [Corynebacterium phocae]APT92537.1 hypothetical protein CPHO_06140 [Corynebacterium phocae]KAA8725140.1 cobalamin biosynthesis protein CobG [Corynebacterium phocae]